MLWEEKCILSADLDHVRIWFVRIARSLGSVILTFRQFCDEKHFCIVYLEYHKCFQPRKTCNVIQSNVAFGVVACC